MVFRDLALDYHSEVMDPEILRAVPCELGIVFLMKYLTISFFLLILFGCTGADKLPITQVEQGFICDGETGYWKEWSLGTGGQVIEQKCRDTAKTYCAKQGKNYREVDSHYANTEAYTASRAQVAFKCLSVAEEQAEKMQAERAFKSSIDSAKQVCVEHFGFKPETTELSQCMLEIQKEKAADARAKMSNELNRQSAQQLSDQMDRTRGQATMQSITQGLSNANQNIINNMPKTTNCSTFGNQTSCRTW